MPVKVKWLMFILKMNGKIHRLKERMAMASAARTLFLAFAVAMMELFLIVVSLPIYLLVKPEHFALKTGASETDVVRFRLRKIIALSSLLVMLMIWAAMELSYGGIVNLYFFKKEELRFEEVIARQPASPEKLMFFQPSETVAPAVTDVKTGAAGKEFIFSGSGPESSRILVFIGSDAQVIYSVRSDETGIWRFTHRQGDVRLAPGRHKAYAVVIDENGMARSNPGSVIEFELTAHGSL